MKEKDHRFDFENFPRQPLQIGVTRRGLFSALTAEIHGFNEKTDGGEVYSMAGLGVLPDEELAGLHPVVVEGCTFAEKEGYLVGKAPSSVEPSALFPLDSPAYLAFQYFKGERPISDIARIVSEAAKWESRRSFAYVRGVFLQLVTLGFCQPG